MTINQNQAANNALLSQLQGNILKGHGREHTANVFLQFHGDRLQAARDWLHRYAERSVTTARCQLAETERFKRNHVPGGLFTGLYLSAAGYQYFKVPGELWPEDRDQKFHNGMKAALLGDPDPTTWHSPFNKDIHVMVLLAHDDKRTLSKEVAALVAAVRPLTLMNNPPADAPMLAPGIGIEYGNAIRNANGDGLEHFGYVDGISQPLFFTDDCNPDSAAAVPAGNTGDALAWDPAADLALVLVRDHADTVHQGSFFVFRKLEQDVRGFKQAERDLANQLGLTGEQRELAGTMLVGRFEDGTPLTVHDENGMIGSGNANNFNYDSDAAGLRCPFQAHVRKSNPRGSARSIQGTMLPSGPGMVKEDKKHIMARRGIPYGLREVSTDFDCEPEQFPAAGGVGLLFQSFQASLGNQFEFIQNTWVNNAGFPFPGAAADGPPQTGIDPLIGQSDGGAGRNFVWPVAGTSHPEALPFAAFVTMRGGEYFYAPSVVTLRDIAALTGNGPGGEA